MAAPANPFEQSPLPGGRVAPGSWVRLPFDPESAFFERNPHVAGMAAEDGMIVLNPFAALDTSQREGVLRNELYRLLVRQQHLPAYDGPVSPQQEQMLNATPFYASAPAADRIATLFGRMLAGDQSAGEILPQQKAYLDSISAPFEEAFRMYAAPKRK